MSEFFLFSVKRLPAGLPKPRCTFPQKNLEGKNFFEQFVCVLLFFRNEPKILGLLAKLFWQGCANCFWPVGRFFFRIFFDKKKSDTFYHSRTLSKHFTAFSRIFSSRVVRKNYLNFYYLPDIERKSFALLTKKMQQGCQNCFLRVYRNSLNGIIFSKILNFFYLFRTWAKKILAFCQFSFDWIVKSVLYKPDGTTRRKKFSWKIEKIWVFNFVSDFDQKKYRLSGKLFSAVLEKLHFTSL